MDALVAFALLLFVVLAPRAIMHACCVDAGAALAALALLLLLVLALLLLSLLLLSLLLRRLKCSTLSSLTRFPFHDSQVHSAVFYVVLPSENVKSLGFAAFLKDLYWPNRVF